MHLRRHECQVTASSTVMQVDSITPTAMKLLQTPGGINSSRDKNSLSNRKENSLKNGSPPLLRGQKCLPLPHMPLLRSCWCCCREEEEAREDRSAIWRAGPLHRLPLNKNAYLRWRDSMRFLKLNAVAYFASPSLTVSKFPGWIEYQLQSRNQENASSALCCFR